MAMDIMAMRWFEIGQNKAFISSRINHNHSSSDPWPNMMICRIEKQDKKRNFGASLCDLIS